MCSSDLVSANSTGAVGPGDGGCLHHCQPGAARPGPVVIDLPMDVQRNALPAPVAVVPIQATDTTLAGDLSLLCQQIAAAQRPLIIAGQGVLLSGASNALRLLAASGIPVSHSLLGLGAIPGDSNLNLGFHGHTGHPCAGVAIQQADRKSVV